MTDNCVKIVTTPWSGDILGVITPEMDEKSYVAEIQDHYGIPVVVRLIKLESTGEVV